ncbi:hypothetical protein Tco_0556438, partial [Tanacetum coccineum]
MDNPNTTMEVYIRLEEEKAHKRRKVFNWETAKYGKIWYDEDVHDLKSVETEFLAIVFNDNLTSNETLFCEPTTSLRFENEFPAIVYNDALTSKSDFLTEPTLKPQHIDEFDLKDETSLYEYDKVEQNVLYFNDLFPFNIIYPDDLKSSEDNDDNKIDIIQSSGCQDMAPLPPREQRHPFLRYQGLEYSDPDIVDFNERDTLYAKMRMEHRDGDGVIVFTSEAWGRVFDTRGPLGRRWSSSVLQDFLGPPPSYTLIRDLVLRLCHRMMAHSIAGRSQAPKKERLKGLTVTAPTLPIIDMTICAEFGDTWAWVPAGPAKQDGDAGGIAEC